MFVCMLVARTHTLHFLAIVMVVVNLLLVKLLLVCSAVASHAG